MSLLLSKNNTVTYDYYSDGDNTDPITALATLDGTGGTVIAATSDPVYLVATAFNYTTISISFTGEEAGINWEVSTDNATWLETITPADMDALATDQTLLIYMRATVINDGSLTTGIYTAPKVKTIALEKPA